MRLFYVAITIGSDTECVPTDGMFLSEASARYHKEAIANTFLFSFAEFTPKEDVVFVYVELVILQQQSV